jgi:hypothetical protein
MIAPVIGDLRRAAAKQSHVIIEKIVNNNSRVDRPYYILMAMQAPAPGEVLFVGEKPKVTFKTSFRKFPKMLSTACWKVDNKKGKLDMLWCLPADAPMPDEWIDNDSGNEKIYKDAQGLDIDG